MSEVNPDSYTPEEMSRLTRGLFEAGWLQGDLFVGQKQLSLIYSEKGFAKMRKLIQVIKPYCPASFGNPRLPSVPFDLAFQIQIAAVAPELVLIARRDSFTVGVFNALSPLVVKFFEQFGE